MDRWFNELGPTNSAVPNTYKDILISDEELIRKFGHMEPDPLIYGGSIVRENVKKFLRSPSKMKMYGKVSKLTEKIRADSKYVKARWDKREREERSKEESD